MKQVILTLSFCIYSFFIYSQKRMNLEEYSKDTLSLLTDLMFLGDDNEPFKYELLSTTHQFNQYPDSVYLYSINNLSYNHEFGTDGNFIGVFLFDSTIAKIPSCTWLELSEITLKKTKALLKIKVHRISNYKETSFTTYVFKVTTRKNNSELLNCFYAPKYRLIKNQNTP